MEIKDFILMYETATPLISDAAAFPELSDVFGKKCSNREQGVRLLQEAIKETLETKENTQNQKKHISRVATCLWVLQLCKGQITNPIINAFETLRMFLDSSQNVFLKPFEDAAWGTAFSYLKTIQILKPHKPSPFDKWAKEKAYAIALKRLQSEGLEWTFSEFDVIKPSNPEHIAKQILHLVREFGGRPFIQQMLDELCYSEEAHRFILSRAGNTAIEKIHVVPPTNYMLHIGMRCIKYPSQVQENQRQARYEEIKQLCTDLCFVTYPVLSFNMWQDIIPSEDLLDYLRKMILRDSIFGLTQTNADFVADFTSYIIERLKKENDKVQELLNAYQFVMHWFLSHADERRFVFVDRNELHIRCKRCVLLQVFDAIQIKQNNANEGFLLPTDYEKYNLLDKPLLSSKDGWLLPPKSIMGFSWYEALLTLLRPTVKQLDNQVGKLMESYIEEKFHSIGVNLYAGKYKFLHANNKEKEGECDHAIESASHIILIEDKRKAVTRASKSGNRDQVLVDIMCSLVASQYQNFRTSSCLLKNGSLTLQQDDVVTELKYNGQKFEHISLDLFDFGPITSRVFVSNVLEKTVHTQYIVDPSVTLSVADKKDAEKTIKRCNQYASNLAEVVDVHYTSIKDPESQKRFNPFFDSWFLSLEQLVFLIGQSTDTSSFIGNLQKIKFVSTGTGEFYNEWYRCRTLNMPDAGCHINLMR